MSNSLIGNYVFNLNRVLLKEHRITTNAVENTANLSYETLNHGVSVTTSFQGTEKGVLITWFSEILLKQLSSATNVSSKSEITIHLERLAQMITTAIEATLLNTPQHVFAPVFCLSDVKELFIPGNPIITTHMLDTHYGPIKIIMSQSA